MARKIRVLLPVLLIAAISACHTDPFSIKPEVPGVQIPDRGEPDDQNEDSEDEAA